MHSLIELAHVCKHVFVVGSWREVALLTVGQLLIEHSHHSVSCGVKIIGATGHIVNDNLDEGPIIAQSVINVGHQLSSKELAKAGRNVEKFVLNRALFLVFEDRVFISGNKTIIFE